MLAVTEPQLPVLGTNGFPLQDAAVYGPIHSRRYGYSLGINPLPVTYKFCDFDCVYCQYGWTPRPLNPTAKKNQEKLKPISKLLQEIETSFQKFVREKTPVDVITIAGNGEPTLYPEFLKFVTRLLELRGELEALRGRLPLKKAARQFAFVKFHGLTCLPSACR